jgi:hypothetical protein
MDMLFMCLFGGWEKGLSRLACQKGTGLFWPVLSGKTAKGTGLALW